jgi:hypothetical protein
MSCHWALQCKACSVVLQNLLYTESPSFTKKSKAFRSKLLLITHNLSDAVNKEKLELAIAMNK